jgi:signal transduction histidine kinase
MVSSYSYTPYIWPMLASAVFFLLLGVYAWRHRGVTGALPFSFMMIFTMFWSLGAAMELAAVDLETKIFWFKFLSLFKFPAVTAEFCFVLQYTGLGKLLTRRNLILLSLPPLIWIILVLTNNAHHLLWTGFLFNGDLLPSRSNLPYFLAIYSYILVVIEIIVFIRLFIRSPQHRWPVLLILSVLLLVHTAFFFDFANRNPFTPLDLVILTWNAGAAIYALVLFVFRIFDPIPLARTVAIKQMKDGMLVLDTNHVIVYLNPAVEKILGFHGSKLKGKRFDDVFKHPIIGLDCPPDTHIAYSEIEVGDIPHIHNIALYISSLMDDLGQELGCLIFLRDVTDEKLAQALLMEQEQALATLQERERLARELHDNAGQLLAYVKMQAQAIRKWVHDGETEKAEEQLTRLANVATEAHNDLRESIFNLNVGPVKKWSFFPTLKQHLDTYQNTYAVRTELVYPKELKVDAFKPEVGVQLLRVIQEALTNARKHGQANSVRVTFTHQDSRARIIVADDGCGFDPKHLSSDASNHFGLVFMSERMEQIGGNVKIISQPGAGTQVLIEAPLREEAEEQK